LGCLAYGSADSSTAISPRCTVSPLGFCGLEGTAVYELFDATLT
jgi:hypothetical protein